jgi:hypothetical protein
MKTINSGAFRSKFKVLEKMFIHSLISGVKFNEEGIRVLSISAGKKFKFSTVSSVWSRSHFNQQKI